MPGATETYFTKENAKELGAKGGKASAEARRKRKAKTADWLRTGEAYDEFVDDLYQAAKGQGRFKGLAADKQLSAVLKIMELAQRLPKKPSENGQTEFV